MCYILSLCGAGWWDAAPSPTTENREEQRNRQKRDPVNVLFSRTLWRFTCTFGNGTGFSVLSSAGEKSVALYDVIRLENGRVDKWTRDVHLTSLKRNAPHGELATLKHMMGYRLSFFLGWAGWSAGRVGHWSVRLQLSLNNERPSEGKTAGTLILIHLKTSYCCVGT